MDVKEIIFKMKIDTVEARWMQKPSPLVRRSFAALARTHKNAHNDFETIIVDCVVAE